MKPLKINRPILTLIFSAALAAISLTACDKKKEPPEMTTPQNYQTATFAAGCFWHVEAAFSAVPGVVSTTVGYTGGKTEKPTYRQVCSNKTGHAEAVKITFDPKLVSYQKLLDTFFEIHDPTTPNRQGPDVGSQYRSAVFYHNTDQKDAAENTINKLNNSPRFQNKIVTQILPAPDFYKAEEYHQNYLQKKKP